MFLRADLYQAGDEFIVEVDVPGMEPDAIELWVGDDSLTITGRREASPTWALVSGPVACIELHRRERVGGVFTREIPLPLPVIRDAAEAVVQDGVLTVRVPIREAAGPARRVEVDPGRADVITRWIRGASNAH